MTEGADPTAAGRETLSPETAWALVDASLAITRELSLDGALQSIVDSACALLDCKYGALGVVGPGSHIEQFITHGVSEAEREQIGHLPIGLGVLGSLIRDARIRRISNLADCPDAIGFPPNHPPMKSFLGAPVVVRNRVYGNLYLTEKRGSPFTESDEYLVGLLASQAGIAIENATLFEESRERGERLAQLAARLGRDADVLAQRLKELEAFESISLMLASEERPDAVLTKVADAARLIFDARGAVVMVPRVEASLPLDLVAVSGPPVIGSVGDSIEDADSPWSVSFTSGRTITTTSLGSGAVAIVPCVSGDQSVGVLGIATDSEGPIEGDRLRLARSLAALAASSLTMTRRLSESIESSQALRALFAVSQDVLSRADTDEIFDRAISDICTLLQSEAAEMVLYSPNGVSEVVASRGIEDGVRNQTALLRRVMDEQGLENSALTFDVDSGWEEFLPSLTSTGTLPVQVTAVPVRTGSATAGALMVFSATQRDLRPFFREVLDGFSAILGVAYESASLVRRIASAAVVDERERIGMELHDGVVQQLFAIGLSVQSAGLLAGSDPEGAKRTLDSVLDDIDECIAGIRAHIMLLDRDAESDDYIEALRQIAGSTRTPGISVDVLIEGESAKVRGAVGSEIVQFVREALSNVVRHSGARSASVECRFADEHLAVAVVDDGRGFDVGAGNGGRGLRNFQRRAERLGGDVEIDSAPGYTRVTMTIPTG